MLSPTCHLSTSIRIWLLGRDAVPLPFVPRLLRSEVPGLSPANDLLMGSGSRADVLVKCDAPGTYVLASAAGPFRTNTDGKAHGRRLSV